MELLHDQWVIKEIREEIKKFLESNLNEKNKLPETMGYSKGSAKGTDYSHECIY
jgi:hypothetical protein